MTYLHAKQMASITYILQGLNLRIKEEAPVPTSMHLYDKII